MKRLLGASIAVASLLACGQSGSTDSVLSNTPTSPSPVPGSSTTIAGAAAASRDAFAGCLSGSGEASCFTTLTVGLPPRGSATSPFADCVRGEGGAGCFAAMRLNALAVGELTAPAAPSGLAGTVSGTDVTLAWTAPAAGDPAASYLIEAGTAPGLSNLASLPTGNPATTFSAGGVSAGQYYVRVRAANGAGTSPPSNEVVLQVGGLVGCGPLGTPTLSVVTNSGGTVGFSWTIPSGSPTAYILQAGSAPGLSNLANLDLRQALPTFTTSGVPPGTYYVRVLARRNNCAVSAPSNEVIVTVGPPLPAGATIRFETGEGSFVDGRSWCMINLGAPFTITVDGTLQGSLSCRYGSILDFAVSPGAHVYQSCVATRVPCASGSFTIAPGELKVITFSCNNC